MGFGHRGPKPEHLEEEMEIEVEYRGIIRPAVIKSLDRGKRLALVELELVPRCGEGWRKKEVWVKFKRVYLRKRGWRST